MDFSTLDRIMEDYRARGYYPSAVCQVFTGRETLYRQSFGAVTPETWFDLASVSKIICTTMLLFAMEEGRLTPEDLVLDRLPAGKPGPVTRKRLEKVTVKQLMTHTSGIVPWYPFYADGREFYTVLEHVLSTTPEEPGMAYSDLNFMLLGLIFTQVTGLTLREGNREYFYRQLDRHFPGLKARYIRAYGNAYELESPNSPRLTGIFHRVCEEKGILHDNDAFFEYLSRFEDKQEQLSLF